MKDTIASLLAGIIVILIDSLFCFWAWNGFAQEFHLPIFNFWHWVCTLMAVRSLFEIKTINKGK